ncbi:MAG: sugar ABC transporter permease, partial [Cyanobacteria bacterium P01_A01_bin.68]
METIRSREQKTALVLLIPAMLLLLLVFGYPI